MTVLITTDLVVLFCQIDKLTNSNLCAIHWLPQLFDLWINPYEKRAFREKLMKMTLSFFRSSNVRGLLTALSMLLVLYLSPSNKPIGVNGFSLSRPSHTWTRTVGRRSFSTSSRLLTTASSNVAISDDDENIPKLKKKLTGEFFSIGFPAFIQLAAEPLAALVVCRSKFS